jgi:hypothetical protein
MWPIDAISLDEATTKVTNALTTLTFQQGPKEAGIFGWRCTYNVGFGYKADAVTHYS